MTKSVYLAGPIPSGLDFFSQRPWRKTASRFFASIGVKAIDPEIIEAGDNFNVVALDKAAIARCDLVLANVTRLSTGTPMEIFFAHSIHKPVVLVCPEALLSPWHEAHMTVLFDTLPEAMQYVQEFFES